MIRVAFRMRLIPGKEAEYRKRHDEIWPELLEEFKKAGIYDYSIFLDGDANNLFAVQKLDDKNTVEKITQTAIFKKWRAHMKGLLEANSDGSPIQYRLHEVFHMD